MTVQRRRLLYVLVPLLVWPWVLGLLGGIGEPEMLLWLVLLLAWVVAFAFTTSTGAPLPRYVRNTMIGILATATVTVVVLVLIPHQQVSVGERRDLPSRVHN